MKHKVLIIDDNLAIREILAFALADHFEVSVRPSFKEGLEALREGAFAAVVTDNDLGDGKGSELLSIAATSSLARRRYLMSAGNEPERHSAHAFFPKAARGAPLHMRLIEALRSDLNAA